MADFPDEWATPEDHAFLWLEQAHAAGISLGSIAYGKASYVGAVFDRTHISCKAFILLYSSLVPTTSGIAKGLPNRLAARHGYTRSISSLF